MTPEPSLPRPRPGLALLEAVATVTASMLLATGLTFALALCEALVLTSLTGSSFPGPCEGSLPSPARALAWVIGVQSLVLAATALALILWRCPPWEPTESWPRRVVWGLGAGIGSFALAGAIAALQELAGIPVEEQEPLLKALRQVPLAVAFPWIAVAAPVSEELFFRGYLFRFLLARGPAWLAYAASVVSFAAIHFNPSGLLVYAAIALVLTAAYRRTGSLLVPILGHAVHNGLTLLVVYAESLV